MLAAALDLDLELDLDLDLTLDVYPTPEYPFPLCSIPTRRLLLRNPGPSIPLDFRGSFTSLWFASSTLISAPLVDVLPQYNQS